MLICGHAEERYFWTRNTKHWERCFVAAFVYVYGLNPEVFMDWAHLMGMCWDRARVAHFNELFRLFEGGRAYRFTTGQYKMSELDDTSVCNQYYLFF